tara:strand:+ start:393 stop:1217 length:825 start_codon:yes stop_codon:yes gene_type:complete
VLGGGSFIASELIKLLKKNKFNYLAISKKKINLTKNDSVKKLSKVIKKKDSLIFISAIAPVKSFSMLIDNLNICKNVFKALNNKKIGYLLYVSSDAVYSDSRGLLSEKSKTNPQNLHGFMHLMRENIIKLLKVKLCIVRPTLVYGPNDPHNGYGPNQFIRLAQSNKNITLFGKGEERRDHIHIKDVGKVIYILVNKKYQGTVNIATGKVYSFFKIANKLKKIYGIKIKYLKRSGPMPHKGYRAFNNKLLKSLLPKNNFIRVLDWIEKKEGYNKK